MSNPVGSRVSEVIAAFLQHRQRVRFRAIREYKLALDELQTYADRCGARTLEEVACMSLMDWARAAGMRLNPKAPARGAQRSLEIADIFFRWAEDKGYLDTRLIEME